MDWCTRETFRFIIYLHSLNLRAGLASLGTRWRSQVPLNLSCGPIVWCGFALFTLMYGAMTGSRSGCFDLMTTCSVCRELDEDDNNPSCPGCTCFFKERGQQVPKVPPCSFGGGFLNARSFSWTQVLRPIRPTRRAGSTHYRMIARFIYPTRCSKCLSGVLIFQSLSLI